MPIEEEGEETEKRKRRRKKAAVSSSADKPGTKARKFPGDGGSRRPAASKGDEGKKSKDSK